MNMQITKNKNTYAANSLQKRVARIEGILQKLLQMSTNAELAGNSQAKIENGKQNDSLSDLILSAASNNSASNPFKPTIFHAKNLINNDGSKNNNIVLSRGQIIAELALVITRASQRNF